MTTTIRIHAVGDVMLGEGPYYLDRGVRTAIVRHGPEHPFIAVRHVLRDADIVLGNMEVACSTAGETSALRSRTFRGPDNGAAALALGGFTVVSLANNHFLTHGHEAARDSYERLVLSGIVPVGWQPDVGSSDVSTEILSVGGHRVAIVALCDEPTTLPHGSKRVDFPSVQDEQVLRKIRALKDAGNLVLLTVHWGAEYVQVPEPRQTRLAKAWVDSGADCVLGHGPHVLQGYEWHNGRPIVYSMGNFLFDQHFWDRTRTSAIIRLETNGSEFNLSYIPVSYSAAFQVTVSHGEEESRLRAMIDQLQHDLPHQSDIVDSAVEARYAAVAAEAYQQMRSRYLRFMLRTAPTLTVRSLCCLLRDAASRLAALVRHAGS